MENLKIYEDVRNVPEEAKKQIKGGRLNGMTDINPMWRIKKLTEQFGPVGIGWYTEIIGNHIEDGANGEKVAVVEINLFVKIDNEWSKPIYGTGGSMLVAKEQKGLYTSDEAFKMAYTDAISVCCKALGFGADVYWEKDVTKYGRQNGQLKNEETKKDTPPKPGYYNAPESDDPVWCDKCGRRIPDYWDGKALVKAKDIKEKFGGLCPWCAKK